MYKNWTYENSFRIAQTGKAFRNEIVARQFILDNESLSKWKCNFCKARNSKEWYEKWKETRLKWHMSLGMEKKIIVFTIMTN